MTKIYLVLWSIAVGMVFPHFGLALVLFAATVVLSLKAGVGPNFARFMVKVLLPILLMMFLVHGLFNPSNHTDLLEVGAVRIGLEGVMYAGGIAARLLLITGAFLLLTMTTHPGRMVSAMVEAGLHPKAGYLVIACLQVIPQMIQRASRLQDAQRSRGLETEGSLLVRSRAFLPLIGPLVLGSLVDLQDRTIALETRAFGVKRQVTSFYDIPRRQWEAKLVRIWMVLSILLVAGSTVWRVFKWLQ